MLLILKMWRHHILVVAATFIFFGSSAQRVYPNYKWSISSFAVLDYDYDKPGIGGEVSLSRKIYKSFYVRVSGHFSNTTYFAVPKSVWRAQTFHPGAEDTYAAYFIGKPRSVFFNGSSSNMKNTVLLGLHVNREFGGGRFKWIPEVGLSLGNSQQWEMFIKGVSTRNDSIITASSNAEFQRTSCFGVNMTPFNFSYKLKNNWALLFTGRLILTNGRTVETGPNSSADIGFGFECFTLGFTLSKSFDTFGSKTK